MDRFKYDQDSVSDPARSAKCVAPQDGAVFAEVPKALFVGSGGDVNLRCMADSTPVLMRNIPAGTVLPLRVVEILSTGTTAGDFVVLA